MIDARRGQPAVNKPPHAVPQHPAVLAATRQGAVPEPADLEPKQAGPNLQMRWEWPQGCNGEPVRGGAKDDGSDPWGHFPSRRRFQP
jgi:hypothetical protein